MEYVDDMTWREFVLRVNGYRRQQKEKWYHTRLVSYYSLVATGAIDTKKISIDKFMPLENKGNNFNDIQRELIKEQQRLAIEEAKRQNG